jgi:restriction system protein
MAIPDFQSFMLPVLQSLSDGEQHHKSEIADCVASSLKLTEEDISDLLPSGKIPRYRSRVNWSLTYLKQALLVGIAERAIYQITERGKEVLQQKPSRIDNKYLSQFQEFVDFRNKSNKIPSGTGGATIPEDNDKTPLEEIELGFGKINDQLKDDLLNQIMNTNPLFFEKLVLDVLVAMGYGGSKSEAARITKMGGDGGIDGIINEDTLGLDIIYIQAKRWENNIGRPEIQKFAGALLGKNATKGVFITTSRYSQEALDYASSLATNIVLIDGNRLASLMIEYNVGVSIHHTYEIKKIDTDYFIDD